MDFATHLQKLIESVIVALDKDRRGLVGDFREILSRSRSLFRSDEFDFWLHELGTVELTELPMTHYGLGEAKSRAKGLKPRDRGMVRRAILDICEYVFTYSHPDDICPLQSDYHYYVRTPDQAMYKQSELGHVEPTGFRVEPKNTRIAKKSELQRNEREFVAA